MIQKIQASEYLKRLDNMTAEERDEYLKRVGEWLQTQAPLLTPKMEEEVARFQNVIQCSAMWNDEECRAFTDGARLLTALVPNHDTWLPDMLYIKAAKRTIRQMVATLQTLPLPLPVMEGSGQTKTNIGSNQGSNLGSNLGSKTHPQPLPEMEGTTHPQPLPEMEGTTLPQPLPEMEGSGQQQGAEVTTPLAHREGQGESPSGVGLPPVRPKHIDQYVHLLPKKTQEHAALVQGLYREFDEAREKMRLLAEDPTASPRDREAWAKKATKCDNALRKIFDELDAEWAKLVEEGRVVVDDLGMVKTKTEQTHPQPLPEMEGSGQTSAAEVTTPLAHREGQGESRPLHNREGQGGGSAVGGSAGSAKSLRKFLVDTRRGNGATRKEHVKKWKKSFKEYAKLVGEEAYKDEKLLEAAKHYEIEVRGEK